MIIVLEDTETAEYTHTLTVTERLGGYYQCIVSNNKPSMASSSLLIQGKPFSYTIILYSSKVSACHAADGTNSFHDNTNCPCV